MRFHAGLPSLFVLALAAVVRFPHYDVAWFGLDQIYFMAEARRAAAGHWDVTGPLASGLNIVGPLYSYLLAALVWLRDDPRLLSLFSVTCDVAAAWLVYDAARRAMGRAAGVAAAVTYVTMPVLVLGTRMIWNPSLLPALVALGWWLVVRYIERPSTRRLAAVAFVAGLTLTLHATGVFHAAGLMAAALLSRRPTLRAFGLAMVAGLVSLTPVLLRLAANTGDVGALGQRFVVPSDPATVAAGLVQIVLAIQRAFGDHWTVDVSVVSLYVQAIAAALGLAIGLARSTPFRGLWVGIGAAAVANVASAFFYADAVNWHYFIALIPGVCLCLARVVALAGRPGVGLATVGVLAASHLLFLGYVDRQAIVSGLIRIDASKIGIRGAQVIGYSPTLRDLHRIGAAVRAIVADGATGLLAARGARGELWRETGAEFLPAGGPPRDVWPTQLLFTGPQATPLRAGAHVIAERLCAFASEPTIAWRAQHAPPPAGWEQPGFPDGDWPAQHFPRRVARASLTGPFVGFTTWPAAQMFLRGRLTSDGTLPRELVSVVIHGAGNAQYTVDQLTVDGIALAAPKSRAMYSSISRNEEWLIDAGALGAGEHLITMAIRGPVPAFDLDLFRVPCLDSEWYR